MMMMMMCFLPCFALSAVLLVVLLFCAAHTCVYVVSLRCM